MEELQLQINDLKLQVHILFESLTELQRQNALLIKKFKEMEDFWYEN